MKKRLIIGIVTGAMLIAAVLVISISNVEQGAPNGDGPRQAEIESPYGETSDASTVGISAGSAGFKSLEATVTAFNSYTEEWLSDSVKTLLGLGGEKHNYNSLGSAIGELSKNLSVDDVTALREMLTWPNRRFPEGMRAIEINAIKNDVLDRLLRQNALPEGIGLQLVAMASNSDNDPVWRDYCVQFMTPYYERASGELNLTTEGTEAHRGRASNIFVSASEAGGEKIDELGAVREAMVAALDERGSTIAGTSLIGLELLSRTHDEFDREVIVGKAFEIAADESASAASRMTAMRLSAQISNNEQGISNVEVAESARLIAQTGETVLLRSAAIVTLGEKGSEADRELLESYILDENRQIARAAQLALQKLDAGQPRFVEPEVVEQVSSHPQTEEKLPPILIN